MAMQALMIYTHALIIHTIITMYSTSLSEKVGNLVERDFVFLYGNTLVAHTVKLMKDKDFSFAFVTQKSLPSSITSEI
jgi:hypothetical protein